MARQLTSVWPPLSPAVWGRRSRTTRPYPLADPSCRLFARARHALSTGLAALGVGPGDRVLLPAWHHGSEVESVRATGATWTFYEPGHGLGPDQAALDRLLGPDVRALHLTHHLGFPQDSATWRRWCDSRGLLLIEDAAQAWLATRDGVPVGSWGDLSVWCLYKTFGLPDGAALLTRDPVQAPSVRSGTGVVPLARRHAAWLAQRVPVARREARAAAYDPIRDFETGTPSGPSRATQWLLPRVASADASAVRRRNFQAYLDAVGHLVPAPFDVLPEGAAPFAFPVAVLDKASALGALRTEGISALNFWAVPHPSLPVALFPRAAWLRRHLLALPVHQELTPRTLRRLVAAARQLLAQAGTPAPSA